jgi:transposase InsO family protein
VPREIRDQVVDVVEKWSEKSGINVGQMIKWLGIRTSKYYNWKWRYGQENHHNAPTPRTFWLEDWEKEKIIAFYAEHPNEGYRRLSYMMLDEDVVAVSSSSVYRVLKKAGMLKKWAKTSSKKGKGFHQPQKPHQHWHIDIAYINICGTFYYLCSVLDGYSRYVVHKEIRESMTEADVEIILERAREKFPEAKPRIISDNGPQFIAKSFKEYIRVCGMTHVRTAPFYPQSNGKIERWHKSLKTECVRPKTPLSLEDARRIVDQFVRCYNTKRLHSAIGYVTPKDKLEGREGAIFADRKRKLAQAREKRARHRQQVVPEITLARIPVSSAVTAAGVA